MSDLLDWEHQQRTKQQAPLAERMRPRSLEDFIGQEHILGPGRLLRRAIEADRISSVIFYGPPGTGKTTLARLIARTTEAHFEALNAVLAGVKDLRRAIEEARVRHRDHDRRTILFVDEVHRFNKSQQDALLPWVEDGTVTLIGATTENPYFEVNKALVSRSRIFQLVALTEADLRLVARRALRDPARGYGTQAIAIDDAALDHLLDVCEGDARVLLNALELAVETTPPEPDGSLHITLAVAEESIQRRAVLYDKEGDAHFDTLSAYIKSMRGSDPDAALYWLARMLYAGEDVRTLLRRLLIFASEDVGMADPQAVQTAVACAQAFDRVGMPEGRYHLAQATLALACAPKSNSTMGLFDALAAVERERASDVPNHLKDPSRDRQGFGHGEGYMYPHAYREHWVNQQYLPDSLQGRVFYQPSRSGAEGALLDDISRRREAQIAAMLDAPVAHTQLTTGPDNPSLDRWVQRALGTTGARLSTLREQVMERARLLRHHIVLDLNAGVGLLTWEAIRQTPEGYTIAAVRTADQAQAITEQANALPELMRPLVLHTPFDDLQQHLEPHGLFPDRILGRNVFAHTDDKLALARHISDLMRSGAIILAETIPRHTQRIADLIDPDWLDPDLLTRFRDAEAAIYDDPDDPLFNWDARSLCATLSNARLSVSHELHTTKTRVVVTDALLHRLFHTPDTPDPNTRPTFAQRMIDRLDHDTVEAIRDVVAHRLRHHVVDWSHTTAYITARR